MRVWAIADLHLSFAQPEGRERHGSRWRDHAAKIEAQWRAAVAAADVVLIPGDISMARRHRDVQPDLAWLDAHYRRGSLESFSDLLVYRYDQPDAEAQRAVCEPESTG